MAMTVQDMMTPDYPAARAEGSVVDAVKEMVRSRFGVIPVVEEDGSYVGTLHAWDVTRLIAQDRDLHTTPVGTVVQGGVTVEPGTTVDRAMAIASGQNVQLMPVLIDQRLEGVVMRADFDAHDRLRQLLGDRVDQLVTEIAPDDEMLYGMRGVYLVGGAVALECIKKAMEVAGTRSPRRILDLPCGHGRVLRMLHAALPEAELTACDVNRDGVDFCASHFGATPVYAPAHPRDLEIDDRFDVIWVGSLFTHFDRERWTALLDKLSELLADEGLLVFTTLGEQGAPALRAFNLSDEEIAGLQEAFKRDGFAYCDFRSMKDWGITLNSPDYVREQVARRPELDLVHFAERAWAPPTPGHDVYACVKRGG